MIDWDRIVEEDGPAVWRICWRLLCNRADAEEAFQEAFIAAVELSRRETLATPRAILQHLATARSIDKLRSRQRRRKRHEPVDHERLNEEASADVTPPQNAEAGELSDALLKALATLPGKQAECFTLHAIEGWAYQEIADRLGLSIDHVGVLIHRARGKLKKSLAHYGHDGHNSAVEPPAAGATSGSSPSGK
ncbi:RNA polymerase sigma factor [Humisphaera borealis]|uniref:RNA polymerase sigma factor n=1 Tax=Humisphaera borealis TaxID=2807512 RepID=A0A7M2X1J6_9BACT|nr:RNA polymerase sigma factor [Humisphaera borealis]QOV90610.1 RNA polymerase sigma factor [Humisphaera borealis]